MRIIAGKFKGRKLLNGQPTNITLRPTTDKNRQAIFNAISSINFFNNHNFSIENSKILDLCCGSGALSIEAISRGAKSATLVDNNPNNLNLAKKNSHHLQINEKFEFISNDVEKLPYNQNYFDLIFLDPPYKSDYLRLVKNLITNNWWQKKSILIIELNFKNNNLINEEAIKMISGTRGIKQNFDKIIQELSNHLNKILTPELNNLKLNLNFIDCKKYGETLFLLLKLH
jgi:16S rRNA (guanine966-N2)-methyltransferase